MRSFAGHGRDCAQSRFLGHLSFFFCCEKGGISVVLSFSCCGFLLSSPILLHIVILQFKPSLSGRGALAMKLNEELFWEWGCVGKFIVIILWALLFPGLFISWWGRGRGRESFYHFPAVDSLLFPILFHRHF